MKLQSLATTELFQLMAEIDNTKLDYSPDQLKSIEATFEDIFEQYLDEVFDVNARISIADWTAAVTAKAIPAWLFNSRNLRSKLI